MKNVTPGWRDNSETGTTYTVEATLHFPSHCTQAARLLSALLFGQRVHPLAGWRQLGIYRLADTVFQLRGLGWPVITGSLEVRNRFGEKCRVAEYRLEPEVIAAAGQAGQEFAKSERELREVA